jgi:nitrite reductase/ring-hydroxylating ferredoxin subunit
MADDTENRKARPTAGCRSCQCFEEDPSRRAFLARGTCALIAAIAGAGSGSADLGALPVVMTRATAYLGMERTYLIPDVDSVNIDKENEVIISRFEDRVYAFCLACPHEDTALRWRQRDLRFQCPRHESKYQPDGTFVSGRATRNMDRFAIRRDGENVVVDTGSLYRSDRQKSAWDAAFIALT